MGLITIGGQNCVQCGTLIRLSKSDKVSDKKICPNCGMEYKIRVELLVNVKWDDEV